MLVNKYIDEIEKVYHYSKITFLFRGQSHHDWGLVSSAHRRIQDKSTESFKNYIQDLIEQTRLKGYTDKNFQNFSDLQILIELQHFGASTCLVDFTKNFLKALWFACQNTISSPNNANVSDGAVFIVDTKNLKPITSTYLSKPINEFICNETLWIWTPENINNRILAQDSVCVFGTPILENLLFKKIKILSNDKEIILYELDTIFNINFDTLFPDFYGFALSQNQTQPLQFPVNHRVLFNHTIKEEKWEDAEALLIKFPNFLDIKILVIFLKKDLNFEKILASYKSYREKTLVDTNAYTNKHTDTYNDEFNILVDALMGEGFSEERYKKYIDTTGVPTDSYGEPKNYIEIFFLELFKLEPVNNGAITWFSDENFNNFKEFVIALCRHKSIPEELTSSLKNVIEGIENVEETQKSQIIELF